MCIIITVCAVIKHTHTNLSSFSDICGAWFGFGSGFGIGFTGTLLLSRAPLLLSTLLSHVVSHSTCSPRSSSPHAHSFVLGTAVINNNTPFFSPRHCQHKHTHARRVFCVFFFYRPTGRPRRTSLPLECHRNATNRTRFVSSARHSTKI